MNLESIDKSLYRIHIQPDGTQKAILDPLRLDEQAREDLVAFTLESEGALRVLWAPIYGIGTEISLSDTQIDEISGDLRRENFITGTAMALEDAAVIVVFQNPVKNFPLYNLRN